MSVELSRISRGGFGIRAILLGVIGSAGFAAPVLAQTFDPPPGCSGILTVQSKSCLVTHVWTCEGDAAGEKWIALFNRVGPFNIRKVDENFQWLETYYAQDGKVETMVLPATDPPSLTELFETQTDTYDFVIQNNIGEPDERVRGFDLLTGEEVVIDGEPLLATEFGYEVVLPNGEVSYRGAGAQFVSEEYRLFFLGTSWSADDPDEVFDASPVDFVYPGEPGFFASNPVYDCGAIPTAAGE
jgi:hypothetical protein